jgi:serine/threonine protein kinase/Tfp pilus assembly protein PilF
MRLEPGARLGAYEIVSSLGAGGMGQVYQARDLRLGRLVAIKFVSPELASDHVASERLAREARLTSLLNHPNIVTVHDVGTADGRPYIVMEFVAGQSLHAALQLQRVKPARAIEIAGQIADGLAVAHAAGIVHRDLKPGNVMLTEDGRAKIVDFGLGKSMRPASGDEDPTTRTFGLTDTMVVVGTAGYMAPEQVASRPIDFRADQFALGTMLYEMITGRRAFKRDTPVQTMAAIVDTEPAPLAELCPDAPIEVVKIVERCLAKDPANRYGSTSDLARDLREIQWMRSSRASRSGVIIRRAARRPWRWIAVAAVFIVAAVVATMLYTSARTDAPLAQARGRLDRFDKQPNVDQAIDLLLSSVSARPKDAAARTMLAEAYWRKFEYNPRDPTLATRAGEQAGTALTLDRSYAPVHVVLAMINFGQGRYDGALGEAQTAISLDSKLSRAWRELGRVHFRLGQREEAEKDFLKAVALDPDDWTAHNSLGSLYLSLNRLDEAIAEYERVQALAPDNTRAYNNLGSAFLLQERFDKATEMYERSLSLDRNQTAYSNLGTALYQQGRYADAARSFEGAVALPGATFLHWFNLGAACYWAPDLRARAREAYATAVKLGEQARTTEKLDPLRIVELASSHAVLALLAEGAEAKQHRDRAYRIVATLEEPPRDGNFLTTLATTYEELGDRAKALDWLGQAIKAGHSLKRIERSPWLKDLRTDERYARLRSSPGG